MVHQKVLNDNTYILTVVQKSATFFHLLIPPKPNSVAGDLSRNKITDLAFPQPPSARSASVQCGVTEEPRKDPSVM